MSTKQQLQKKVAQFSKAKKEIEQKVNKAVEQAEKNRQEQTESPSRLY